MALALRVLEAEEYPWLICHAARQNMPAILVTASTNPFARRMIGIRQRNATDSTPNTTAGTTRRCRAGASTNRKTPGMSIPTAPSQTSTATTRWTSDRRTFMPEGDTIFRAARTLHRALAGRTVTRFESVFPALSRVDVDTPLAGRTVEGVTSHGKHLLMIFSGDLILRTHMRMNGSWHIYRPGEKWQRPHRDMRVIVETGEF